MRIVFVIDSLALGGTERSVADLARALPDVGVEPVVIQLRDRAGHSSGLREAGVEVMTLTSSGRLRRIPELRSVIRRLRPDLVHTQLFEADAAGRPAARAAGVPVVSSLVNEMYGEAHRATPGIRRHRLAAAWAADAASARLVRRFHAVSNAVARAMVARLHIPPTKVEVVPRGRDGQALGRRDPARSLRVRQSLGLSPSDTVVLAVGRHEWQKGFDVLIEALGRGVPSGGRVTVLLAGRQGNATEKLRAASAHLNPERCEIRILGGRSDVADLMVASDLLVSASRWEGLPGTLIEALALEIPIVATDIEPTLEVVGDLAGVALVPVDSAGALAEAITAGLSDRPDTAGYRERFEARFELRAVAQEMYHFYQRALDPPEPVRTLPGLRLSRARPPRTHGAGTGSDDGPGRGFLHRS